MAHRQHLRGRWFKRVLWIGIVANLALAIPTLLAPERLIDLIGLPPAAPLLWPRFAALLLILLSVFYMPAGIDLDRYPSGGVAGGGLPAGRRGVLSRLSTGRVPHAGPLRSGLLRPRADSAGHGRHRMRTTPCYCGAWEKRYRDVADVASSACGRRHPVRARWRSAGCSCTTDSSASSRRPISRPTKSISSTARSAPRPSRAFPTGSGWCCRACSRSTLPGPGGYASLGILSRDGHEMPVGFSKVTVGFPRVGINCAVCHTASFRARPDDVPTLYPAGASHQTARAAVPAVPVRLRVRSAVHRRHHPGEIAKNTRLPLIDRLLYRFAHHPRHATRR